MNEAGSAMREAGVKRRGGRAGRRASIAGAPLVHRPALVRNIPLIDVLDEDGVERIHDMAMTIVEEIGVDFRDQETLDIWRRAGARVEGERVRAGREMLEELVACAPVGSANRLSLAGCADSV